MSETRTQDTFSNISNAAQHNADVIKNRDNNTIAGDVSEQQFYKAGSGDTTSVKIPIVYGTVLTKGVIIDEGVTQASTNLTGTVKDTINFKHYKILMSEGDCNGIKSAVKNHTVINNRPLEDVDTGLTELNGVEIKQRTSTVTDWSTNEKMSDQSKDVDISIFKGSTTNLANNVTRQGFLQGLSDVTTNLTNGFVLQYNSDIDKFEGKHLNTMLNDAGLFTTSAANPFGTSDAPGTWLIPHASSFTVTLGTDIRADDSPFRWWKNAAIAGNTTGANDTTYATNVLLLDGLARPDLLMYDGVSYTFTCDNLGSGNGFFLTSDFSAEFTSGVSSTNAATGTTTKTENGTFTFTPTSSTPRVLYYMTQAAVNTGGRILVRSV